jgi:hypothetical protein
MVANLQNSFVFQLVIISAVIIYVIKIKGYLYKAVTDEAIFVVPEHIKTNSNKRKKVLVLDMDETLVYTRRNTKPSHSNYSVIDVNKINNSA